MRDLEARLVIRRPAWNLDKPRRVRIRPSHEFSDSFRQGLLDQARKQGVTVVKVRKGRLRGLRAQRTPHGSPVFATAELRDARIAVIAIFVGGRPERSGRPELLHFRWPGRGDMGRSADR